MKNDIKINSRLVLLLGFICAICLACEREFSDEVAFATFSNNPEVYIDGFTAGLEYQPFLGSKFDAFSVDEDTSFSGSSSMRFDVPNAGDPNGAFAGAIFPLQAGRNLTQYDALTFWAKASQAGTINEVGFGNNFGENKFLVTRANLRISTSWTKYIIPIPDPKKLVLERGMFWYAEGPENNNGYSFWIDELKYETLGTIAQGRPAMQNGEDVVTQSFLGDELTISGLTQTFNLASGVNQTVSAAPSYFDFKSSNTSVARVNEQGVVTVLSPGTVKITASLDGVTAQGSLTLTITGGFDFAPVPTRASTDVISIFSDAYVNVPVEFLNGFWEPFQTTLSADFLINGDNILNYTNFNFVGNQFGQPPVDVTEFPNFHIDIFIPGEIDPGVNLLITLKDFGEDGNDGGGDDEIQQIFFENTDFEPNTWKSFDIPVTLTNRTRVGQIIYENINFSPLSNLYIDNIYFFRE